MCIGRHPSTPREQAVRLRPTGRDPVCPTTPREEAGGGRSPAAGPTRPLVAAALGAGVGERTPRFQRRKRLLLLSLPASKKK